MSSEMLSKEMMHLILDKAVREIHAAKIGCKPKGYESQIIDEHQVNAFNQS